MIYYIVDAHLEIGIEGSIVVLQSLQIYISNLMSNEKKARDFNLMARKKHC